MERRIQPDTATIAVAPAPEGTERINRPHASGHSTWQRILSSIAILTWIASLALIVLFPEISQAIVISGALGTIALLTFAAFYSATGTEGMRTAIAATLVVFYLVLITHLIAAPGLRNQLDTPTPGSPAAVGAPPVPAASAGTSPAAAPAATTFGRDIFNGLTEFVKLVLLFYFTAVTAEKAIATVTASSQNRASTEAAATTTAAAMHADRARSELETARLRGGAGSEEPSSNPPGGRHP